MTKNFLNNKFSYWQLIDLTLFFVLLMVMWLLFSGNTGNADYDNYSTFYEYYSFHIFDGFYYPGLEKGFSLIMQIANFFGLDYNQFLGIYAFIGLFLIANSILKYSNIRFLPLFLYFSYQFFLDVVQIRNFMLLAVFVFSLRYLVDWYETDKRMSLFKYIIWIFIGLQFHITGAFFLLPIFTKKFTNQKLTILISFVTMFLFIVKPVVLQLLNTILSGTKYLSYLENQTSSGGSVLMIVYILFGLIIMKQLYERIINNKTSSNQMLYFSEVGMILNILLILTIFLFSIRPDFIRIVRNVQVISYIMLAQCLNPLAISLKSKNLLSSTFFVVFFIGSTYAFLWFSNLEGVLQPVLNNNMFFAH